MADKSERKRKLTAKFRVVAGERVARLDATFGALESGGGDENQTVELMREIHTLKGESRLMGFDGLNQLAHRTEDVLAWVRDREFKVTADVVDLVYRGLDLMRAELPEDAPAESEARTAFLEAARSLVDGGEAAPADEAPEIDHGPRVAPEPEPEPEEDAAETRFARTGSDAFIRVPVETLSGLTSLASELLLRQEAVGRAAETLLPAIRKAAGDIDAQWQREAVDQVRTMRDEHFEARIRVEELQDRIRRLRLLEVKAIFDRYPPAIRELAREQGKRVRVVVEGAFVSVDKQILDQVDAALLHLVRNSVDHGLETPAERKAEGKPEQATVGLGARQVGSQVEIWVRDDGRGVDPSAVRAAAVRKGLLTKGQADATPDEEIIQLIFNPGFSTREEVSDLSGRGVGLDVVKADIEALGGLVRLATRSGRGTTFTMRLPISVALTRVLVFEAGGVLLSVPASHVASVERPTVDQVEDTGSGQALTVDGHRIPLIDPGRVVGGDRVGAGGETLTVVVLEQAGQRVGLGVSVVHGERQSVQQPLGRFLAGVKVIAGCVILEGGRVGLVLNVPEMLRQWGAGRQPLVTQLAAGDVGHAHRRILIVDDSELTRDMLVGAAQRLELETMEAVNGRDGLTCVHEKLPDLVLTDLDMPVMDGFAFIEALRADALTRDTPIIVLSTRGSEEDKRRALDAGANGYVVKADFTETDLRGVLGRYLDLAAV